MISNQETLHLSPYMAIYGIVVNDNMLRQINELVDFSFILEELQTKILFRQWTKCHSSTRMFKYLLLKAIYDVSDVDLVERSKYDMSFKYFLDMAPEDPVIDPSSLTKFRRLRLQDVSLLDMLIGKTVEIALRRKSSIAKRLLWMPHIQKHVTTQNHRKNFYKRNQKRSKSCL